MTTILPYAEEHVPLARDFNRRLRKAGVEFQFPETPYSTEFPPREGAALRQDYRIAIEDGVLRGGYILKTEDFFSRGAEKPRVGNYQLPLSEGVVDRRHSMIGAQLLWDALEQNSRLYSLGMGGTARPLPRMLERLGWSVDEVPFYFKILRAGPFLREIRFLREKPRWAPVLDALRFTGLGALGVAGWNLATRLRRPAFPNGLSWREVPHFGGEIDALFEQCRASYEGLCARGSAAMALRFRENDPRYVRLLVERGGQVVGWAVLTRSELSGHKQFGDLKLGSIADNLSLKGFESAVARAALTRLDMEGVDLAVTNQSHARWRDAFRCEGLLEGPSNFALARSPLLREETGPLAGVHFTRGDGDGPINL